LQHTVAEIHHSAQVLLSLENNQQNVGTTCLSSATTINKKDYSMKNLLIKNVRPMGKATVDVLIEAGIIRQMQPNIVPPEDAQVLEGHNHLILPGLVNAHAHIDKNLFGLLDTRSSPSRAASLIMWTMNGGCSKS
jgi:hypothetical protein